MPRFHTVWILWTLLLLPSRNDETEAFAGRVSNIITQRVSSISSRSHTPLSAKPQRLQDNTKGVVYVNDRVSRAYKLSRL